LPFEHFLSGTFTDHTTLQIKSQSVSVLKYPFVPADPASIGALDWFEDHHYAQDVR
jgi:hypothetical protein